MNTRINTPDVLGGTDKKADYPKIAFWKNAKMCFTNAVILILIACEVDIFNGTSKKLDDFVGY